MTFLGLLAEAIAICAVAFLALSVALGLSVMKRHRQLARKVAFATGGAMLGLLAGQGTGTIFVIALAKVATYGFTFAGREVPDAFVFLLLAIIGLGAVGGAVEGLVLAWQVAGGEPVRAAITKLWFMRTLQRRALVR